MIIKLTNASFKQNAIGKGKLREPKFYFDIGDVSLGHT